MFEKAKLDIGKAAENRKQDLVYKYNFIADNYNLDARYDSKLNTLLSQLNGNELTALKEKEIRLKERKRDIEEYYHSEYGQLTVIVQWATLFVLLGLVGGTLHRYGILPNTFFMIYLGTIAAMATIVLIYYLWDFYTRDPTVFQEYNFNSYVSVYPSSPGDNVYTPLDLNLLSC
jgi:membrane-bound ClpP family serine protease